MHRSNFNFKSKKQNLANLVSEVFQIPNRRSIFIECIFLCKVKYTSSVILPNCYTAKSNPTFLNFASSVFLFFVSHFKNKYSSSGETFKHKQDYQCSSTLFAFMWFHPKIPDKLCVNFVGKFYSTISDIHIFSFIKNHLSVTAGSVFQKLRNCATWIKKAKKLLQFAASIFRYTQIF